MGWEYGIKVADVKDIKALMERLAEALPRIDGYRMQRDEDGFVLLQNNSDWPGSASDFSGRGKKY